MSERDDFLAWVDSRVRDAEIALHDGDAGPRREMVAPGAGCLARVAGF